VTKPASLTLAGVKIFRSVMRFTLCSFGDELNSRSPVKETTDTYRRGQEWTRLGYTAAGSTSTSRRFRARQPTPWYCLTAGVRNPRASPVASAQSYSLGFGDIGPIPARPPANHQMPRDVLRNGWLHRARGRPRPGRFARRNRPISLSPTDDRRSRWRVSSPKYVGRPRASLRQQV
jgi:hypothetical protein